MKFKLIKLKRMSLLNRIMNEESGAVVVIVAASMVVLMSLLALVIDVGIAYLDTGEIQKAADAAVYSAGRQLPIDINDSQGIIDIKDSAIHYASLNASPGLTRDNVSLGKIVRGQYTELKVIIPERVPMNFAKIFGVDYIDISRSAGSKLSPVNRTTGLAPIGLTKTEMDTRLATNNLTHVTLKYGTKSGSQSFFGALDLDGKGGGASDYRIWIAQGYEGEISVGDILLEESGNMVGPTYQGFITRYNGCTHFGAKTGGEGCTSAHFDSNCSRIVKVPIYSLGNDKKTVVVEGFAAFLLESQTNDGYITGSFLKMITTGGSTGGDAGIEEGSDYGVYNIMLSE
ncbi:MAG: pilus assembly protein TadG-related protein [Acetobacterium sp.]